jgi:orotate phosphoribosyltransferase
MTETRIICLHTSLLPTGFGSPRLILLGHFFMATMTKCCNNPVMRDLIKLIQKFSLKRGDFTLASGVQSDYLIDLKTTALHPRGSCLIAEAILEHIRNGKTRLDTVGGMAMGAVPIVAVVCSRSLTSSRVMQPIPAFYVRKEGKTHGSRSLIDGFLEAGMRAVLVEDVTTTGGSVLQAVDAVRAVGAEVLEVISVVDRMEGALDNLAQHGITLSPLLTKLDIL